MIKFVFRWAFRLVLLAVVLVIGLLLLKDTLIKSLLERQLRQRTGLPARMEKMEVGLMTPTIAIQNLVLHNASEFGGSVFLDIPDLYLEYHPNDLPFGKMRLKLLRLQLREISIVENLQGQTNLVNFLTEVAPRAQGGKGEGSDGWFELSGIDLLNLSVGRVRYENLRLPRRNQDVQLNLQNQIIPNVRSEQDLTALLLKILLRAGITIYADSPRLPQAPPGGTTL